MSNGVRAPAGRTPPAIDVARAERRLQEALERSSDLLAIALLDGEGRQLAATDEADWEPGAAALWAAADSEAPEPARQVHVATGDGEVFALRAGRLAVVATARRFALASLVFCDLRALLRELEGGVGD